MKKLITKWNSMSLILRIFIGLVTGAVLACVVPNAGGISILGDIFVGALKAVAPVLVFILVMSSLANADSGISKTFRMVIILYMLSTLLSALTAVAGSFIFSVSLKLTEATSGNPPSGIVEVLRNLVLNMVANPVSAISSANYIGILTWAIILGLALKKFASGNTRQILSDFSDAVSFAVRFVISLAPFGILGLVFKSVSTEGLNIFATYGKLLALLVGSMLTVAFILNPIIIAICLKKNPYPLAFRCYKESGITAFFTRSSAANIPVNMALCERLGLDKNFYSVSIPLGATINMSGAAVTITVMTLAAVKTLGLDVDVPTAFMLSVLASIGACGASGVAGGSLLLIPMACSLFGIDNDVAMQVVGVGFIIGIIQDSFETALNSSSDVLFAATAEMMHRKQNQ